MHLYTNVENLLQCLCVCVWIALSSRHTLLVLLNAIFSVSDFAASVKRFPVTGVKTKVRTQI